MDQPAARNSLGQTIVNAPEAIISSVTGGVTTAVQAPHKVESKVRKFFRTLGPGLITGASDDDPSGIATYSQTGAQFGYGQLWTALFGLPLMTAVQEMCARIGLVTGEGLAGNIRRHYPRYVLYFSVILLFIANTINVGADLGAMAAAMQLLVPKTVAVNQGVMFVLFLTIITLVSLSLQIALPYKSYARVLKFLTFTLFAYFAIPFIVGLNWTQVLHDTVVPSFSFNKAYLMNIVAILGTTISPYLFFWQTNEEVEEEIEQGETSLHARQGTTKKALQLMRTDVMAGMAFSQIVMWFIVVTTAATLATHGITNIESAPQAAEALRPIAGNAAYFLFALGIIGTGMLAVPILSGSAAYALAEAMHWREGLGLKFKQARAFYTVIIVSVLIGVATNFIGINPIKMLYYTAIINGIVAPPLLFLIIRITSNKQIMGSRTNSAFSNALGYLTFVVMGVSAIALVIMLLLEQKS